MKRASCGVLAALIAGGAWAAEVPAVLQWSQRVELSSPVSGVVKSVQANVGDRVKRGHALVVLDAAMYQAQVAEANAMVTRAWEEAEDAQRHLERMQELYNRTVLSTSELEAAQVRHAKAKAQVVAAQSRLAAQQKQLADATVRAPFDAWVVARQVEPGQTVSAQLSPPPLIVVARAGEMLARAEVSLAQVEKLKVGDKVTVAVGDKEYGGRVRALGLEPMGGKRDAGYAVDVVFPVQQALRAGTPATLKLP